MGGNKMFEQIFNLKFTSKQLAKQSVKSEKEEKAERLKVKKAIEKGNIEGAKIYAQNAIRKKNEALNYLRLASRLDAVVSRLDSQAKMQMVSKNMEGIVKNLNKALNTQKLDQIASTMQQFEAQFNDLDVQSDFVEQAMTNQAVLSTPEEEVNDLMQQVADEHKLEIKQDLPFAGTSKVSVGQTEQQDDLQQRLENIR